MRALSRVQRLMAGAAATGLLAGGAALGMAGTASASAPVTVPAAVAGQHDHGDGYWS
ncbi:hypothetical protein ACGFSG_26250 [Streptomyces sp. NPDC048512]|uniref:hypothetical protein n=1 Tax=unclassified Streptomyces TaxID=2593676 RepID=UPI0015C4CC6C|nr:hypothetical protein [Streptomyces sp. M41(2017)]